MKITSIETILVQIPFDIGGGPQAIAGAATTKLSILLVRVDTDAGISGWGEAFGHGVCPATKSAIDTLIAPLFIGRDATDIAALMLQANQQLHLFGRNGPLVYGLSGIDIALWDIAGKRAGLPLHQLMGAAPRKELRAYASLLRYGESTTLVANARRAVAQGYRHVKLHEVVPSLVAEVRAAIGPDIALMVDTNCPWTVTEAREKVAEMRELDIHWLEEPVWPPEDHPGLAQVRAEGMPISAGENTAGLHDFRSLFEEGAIDVAQPSVTKVGGITEMRKIIALAEAFGVRLVPHCAYFGPGYLASMHIAATLAQDTPLERLFMDLEASPFSPHTEAVDGKVPVPQGPGLGCDPDPAVLERYRTHAPTVTR
jgi:D-galactarolactone cycloisomerase